MSVLEHALVYQKKAHKVSDLEVENTKLRETLAEYNHEFAEVRNQGEEKRHIYSTIHAVPRQHFIYILKRTFWDVSCVLVMVKDA